MSNPFDQFDAASTPTPAAVTANPFDQFDAPTPAPQSNLNYIANAAADASGNLARGGVQGLASIPDIPELAYNLTQKGLEKLTDTPPRENFPYRLPMPVSSGANMLLNAMNYPNDMPDVQRLGAGLTSGALSGPMGAVAGTTGAAGGVAAEHAGVGPMGQALASVITGTPPATAAGIYNAIKTAAPTGAQWLASYMRSRPDMAAAITNAQDNMAQAARSGVPNTLPEALEDPSLMMVQGKLAGQPSTMGAMAAYNKTRDALVPQKMQDLVAGMGPAQSSDEAGQTLSQAATDNAKAITAQLVKQSQPLYEEAFTKSLPDDDPILEDPIVQHYIGTAKKDVSLLPLTRTALYNARQAAEGAAQEKEVDAAVAAANANRANPYYTPPSPSSIEDPLQSDATSQVNADNSVSVLHAVLKKMDQAIYNKYDLAAPADTATISTARGNLLDAIDAHLNIENGTDPITGTNVYKQAREIYTGQPDLRVMRQKMGALADIDESNPRAIAGAISRGGDTSTQAMANALGPKAPVAGQSLIYDSLENNPETNSSGIPGAYSVPGKIYSTPAQQQRMATLVGPGNAQTVDDTMSSVQRANLSNKYRSGSQTNPLEDAGENLKTGGNNQNLLKAGVSLWHGDYYNGITNLMSKIQTGKGYDPQMLGDLQSLITTPKGMDLLKELQTNPDAYMAPTFRQKLMGELQNRAGSLTLGAAINANRSQ